MSGFFFWGMMEEPVENASSSSMNLNSQEHHRIISSEKRDRCTITRERAAASSTAKSRSDTPSRELAVTPSMPRAAATASLSRG